MKRGTKIGWLLIAVSIVLSIWVIVGQSSKATDEDNTGVELYNIPAGEDADDTTADASLVTTESTDAVTPAATLSDTTATDTTFK